MSRLVAWLVLPTVALFGSFMLDVLFCFLFPVVSVFDRGGGTERDRVRLGGNDG